MDSNALKVDLSHLWASLWDLRVDVLDASLRSFPPLVAFGILVGKYIDRKLSHSEDALNAAAGVLRHLAQGGDPVLNFAGLPYYRGPEGTGTLIPLENAIGHALGWHEIGGSFVRRSLFPSWTWAGWSGSSGVGWMRLLPEGQTSHLCNVQLENESGEALMLPKQINAAYGPILQRQLDAVKAIVFEAPCLPVTGYTTEDHQVHVSGHSFYLNADITDHDVKSMNAQQGLWSCFLLTTCTIWQTTNIVLLCRWIDGRSAERFYCWIDREYDGVDKLFETRREMRRVRLI